MELNLWSQPGSNRRPLACHRRATVAACCRPWPFCGIPSERSRLVRRLSPRVVSSELARLALVSDDHGACQTLAERVRGEVEGLLVPSAALPAQTECNQWLRVVGTALGFSRDRLEMLATAALFHDIATG